MAVNLFSKQEISLFFDVPMLQPHVLKIGPLEVLKWYLKAMVSGNIELMLQTESRYNVYMTSGVKRSRFNNFVLNTHHSWFEANIAVINCAEPRDVIASSTFIVELTRRCQGEQIHKSKFKMAGGNFNYYAQIKFSFM